MQQSPYNNPMFAQGLAGLVQSFIGNPSAEAQAQEAASRALLNNQTAQFRDAIGDTGLQGDLASMMIRALQAGPDYSRYAPGIGDATIRMGALGFGGPQHTPRGDIAALFQQAIAGGGRGRGRPSGSGDGSSGRALGAGDRSRFISAARRQGLDEGLAYSFLADIEEGLSQGRYPSPEAAFSHYLSEENWERDDRDVERGWLNPMRYLEGPTRTVPGDQITGVQPYGARAPADEGAAVQALNQAREAIARGASREAVIARLVEMGIDPGGL